MNIAILYSGQYREHVDAPGIRKKNLKLFDKLDYNIDYYFSTWNDKKTFEPSTIYFDEPMVEYDTVNEVILDEEIKNPKWEKIKTKRNQPYDIYKNGTKQIIGHGLILDTIDQDKYDLIIRMRWDIDISKIPCENMKMYIQESWDSKCAVGLGKFWPRRNYDEKIQTQFLLDLVIIHPSNFFDTQTIYDLNNQRKLRFAEFGWYQIMSKNDNHKSYMDKNLIKKDLKK